MLNKINPLYILLFVFTILLISFTQLNTIKDEYTQKAQAFNGFKKDTKVYTDLKTRWDSKTEQKKIIQRVISSNRSIEVKEYKNKTILTLRSKNNRDIEKFVNKILNESLIILKLDIKPQIAVFELGLSK